MVERGVPLDELRAGRRMTQMEVARALDISQAAVSQLEGRRDVSLGTLGNYVEAMGGELEVYAVFPEGRVKLAPGLGGRGSRARVAGRRGGLES